MTDSTHQHEGHGGQHGAASEEFWESLYSESERLGSGRVNPVLAEVAEPLPPGRALDLGCGEGSDAIWLAGRGWQVTAVDISATVLARAGARAEAAGVGSRIDWQQHDLTRTFPPGHFDLVQTHYLHSPLEMSLETVLRAASGAVAPGGLLLVAGHAAPTPWAHDDARHMHFPTPQEVLASLALPESVWRTDRADVSSREADGPDGSTGTVTDSIVAATRLS